MQKNQHNQKLFKMKNSLSFSAVFCAENMAEMHPKMDLKSKTDRKHFVVFIQLLY